jgi:hypothetical protein
MVSILLLVLVALWLDVVPTCSSLTTLIQSKKLSWGSQMSFSLRGNGFNQDLSNDLCLVVQSSS